MKNLQLDTSSVEGSVSRRLFLQASFGAAIATMGDGMAFSESREQGKSKDEPTGEQPTGKQPRRYVCIDAEGTHRELGRQHGGQAVEYIKTHLDYMQASMKLSKADLEHRAMQFRPLLSKHCPHLLDEIAGLAEGARISPAEALSVNIRGALSLAEPLAEGSQQNVKTSDGGCTAFAITREKCADGNLLIGQNSDMLPAMVDMAYVLRLRPTGKPAIMTWTFGGMIGYHGVNSRGIAHFANDLGGGPKARFGLPHYPLKRLALECSDLDEVLELFRTYPLASNGNYVLCDGTGRILDIEATTDGPEILSDENRGFLAHANHFLSTRYATKANWAVSTKDSFARQQRIEELITDRLGSVTLQDMQANLRSRDRHVAGICRVGKTPGSTPDWEQSGITVASIIAEPLRGKLHVAAANDPANPFVEYTF